MDCSNSNRKQNIQGLKTQDGVMMTTNKINVLFDVFERLRLFGSNNTVI